MLEEKRLKKYSEWVIASSIFGTQRLSRLAWGLHTNPGVWVNPNPTQTKVNGSAEWIGGMMV